jgi:hypothetical protein
LVAAARTSIDVWILDSASLTTSCGATVSLNAEASTRMSCLPSVLVSVAKAQADCLTFF